MFKSVKIREGHDNFFTPLRLLFAVAVVLGHAFGIALGDPSLEPHIFYHYNFSYIAVNMFFIASGFLVTKSMLFRGDTAEYSSARLLRIYPALAAHVLFVMFIIGPLATSLPLKDFLTHPELLLQPVYVLSFFETNMIMPGAFEGNGEQHGSAALWTLRYEMLAYIGTALAFSLGFMRKKWMLLAQFVVCAIAWTVIIFSGYYEALPPTGQNLLRFGVAYGLGAAIYAYRERLSFNILGLPVLLVLCYLFKDTPFLEVTMNMLIAYLVFWLAYIKAPKLKALQSMNDLSYGIYIYHWCILQTLFLYMPTLGTMTLFVIALPITVLLAYLSWHLVEKPMLSRKKSFSEYLRFGRGKPAYNPAEMLTD